MALCRCSRKSRARSHVQMISWMFLRLIRITAGRHPACNAIPSVTQGRLLWCAIATMFRRGGQATLIPLRKPLAACWVSLLVARVASSRTARNARRAFSRPPWLAEYAKHDMNGGFRRSFTLKPHFGSSRGSSDEHTSLRVLAFDSFVSCAGRVEAQGPVVRGDR